MVTHSSPLSSQAEMAGAASGDTWGVGTVLHHRECRLTVCCAVVVDGSMQTTLSTTSRTWAADPFSLLTHSLTTGADRHASRTKDRGFQAHIAHIGNTVVEEYDREQ